jgi:hypothetical protein
MAAEIWWVRPNKATARKKTNFANVPAVQACEQERHKLLL